MLRHVLIVASMSLSACTVQHVPRQAAASVDEHMSHMNAADLTVPAVNRSSSASSNQGTPGLPASALTAAARLQAVRATANGSRSPGGKLRLIL